MAIQKSPTSAKKVSLPTPDDEPMQADPRTGAPASQPQTTTPVVPCNC